MEPVSGNPVAEQAQQRIQALASQLEQLLFIHYDCGLLEHATKEPVPIYCIVVQRGDGSESTVFGTDGHDERQSLDDFAAFVEQHADRIWVHWNMRDAKFGFDAILRRHRHLGGKPAKVPIKNRFDLAQALVEIHGDNYVAHPRLDNLLQVNGIVASDMLTTTEREEAWKEENIERLLASTLRRVRSIRSLFVLASTGELRTGPRLQCQSPSVLLFGPCEKPRVNGKDKRTLRVRQYNAIQALIQAGSDGLSKSELDKKSGHTEARKAIAALVEKDDDWAAVIIMPGKTGGRYRIR